MESKYLEFRFAEQKAKTKVWEVVSKSKKWEGIRLGLIKYYPAWRQYCFFPEETTIFSDECLQDIQLFLNYENDLRKK